jgi:hypothetical protein
MRYVFSTAQALNDESGHSDLDLIAEALDGLDIEDYTILDQVVAVANITASQVRLLGARTADSGDLSGDIIAIPTVL